MAKWIKFNDLDGNETFVRKKDIVSVNLGFTSSLARATTISLINGVILQSKDTVASIINSIVPPKETDD